MSPHDAPRPWVPSLDLGLPQARTRPQRLPLPSAESAVEAQSADAPPSEAAELTEAEYRVVGELRDRVSTRLTAEDKNYAAGPRRELTKKLIRDEYDQWLLHEANRGRAGPDGDHRGDDLLRRAGGARRAGAVGSAAGS